MVTKQEVKTYIVNKTCDQCNDGNLIWHHREGMFAPKITNVHKCEKCGATVKLESYYPQTVYLKVDGTLEEITEYIE